MLRLLQPFSQDEAQQHQHPHLQQQHATPSQRRSSAFAADADGELSLLCPRRLPRAVKDRRRRLAREGGTEGPSSLQSRERMHDGVYGVAQTRPSLESSLQPQTQRAAWLTRAGFERERGESLEETEDSQSPGQEASLARLEGKQELRVGRRRATESVAASAETTRTRTPATPPCSVCAADASEPPIQRAFPLPSPFEDLRSLPPTHRAAVGKSKELLSLPPPSRGSAYSESNSSSSDVFREEERTPAAQGENRYSSPDDQRSQSDQVFFPEAARLPDEFYYS